MIHPHSTNPDADIDTDLYKVKTLVSQEFASGFTIAVTPDTSRRHITVAQSLACGKMRLSVVIPLLNEEGSIEPLYHRLKAVLGEQAPDHEIIFVDDGSRDDSYARLQTLWRCDSAVTVLRFRRNFGKAAALSAGFARVSGDILLMMDADLQDQPEELSKLVAKLDEGYDLVTGWKRRRHDPLGKTLPSKLFNGTVARYFHINIHDFNCGFKIMRASVAGDLVLYGDLHRFIPVLAADKGYRIAECAVEHAPRVHGVSKYGARRLITGMFDFCSTVLMIRFYSKPLHFFGTIGLAGILLGGLLGGLLMVAALLGQGGAVWPLCTLPILFVLAGVVVMGLGLIAEMLVRVAHHPKTEFDVAEVLEARAVANG